MNKEILFAQKLGEIRKLAKEQGNYVTKKQVAEAFAELEFQEDQFQMVYDYLTKHKIGIDEPVDLDEYLSEDEVDYLKMYEEELAAMESVTDGQREAILLSAMAGETDAKKRLIEIYLPQVIEISKLYTGQGVYIEDLVGEGNLALAQGVTMLGCLECQRGRGDADEDGDGCYGRTDSGGSDREGYCEESHRSGEKKEE